MEKYGQQITDDNTYWNFLGTAWKAGGCFKDQTRWIALFKSQRRNSHKLMKTSERREFSRLPKTVTAYRCCDDSIEADQSICWSLDRKFVEQYAVRKGRSLIVACTFNKADIFAYFNRRRESEILVWRGA
ncbi:hypothetical protein [Alkanindiges illinoisensis]|nr:hypothetical protein [Alkanindiges illinoisensis]